jgi:hypothetical protein
VTPPDRNALAQSMCPRCHRANVSGSLIVTMRSSPNPGSKAQSSASARSIRSHVCHDPSRAAGGTVSGLCALAGPSRSGGHDCERLRASRPVTGRQARLSGERF